jgi:hypothetical protein
VKEADGVKDLRGRVEAMTGVARFMVEKEPINVLGFYPHGDVYPTGGLPSMEGKAQRP